jgi:hypothetical protein
MAMDRTESWRRRRVRALLAGLLVCLPLAGCAKVLATAVYVIKGTNVEAEYGGLKEKRVAVVCRQLASLQYRDSSVPRDLAARIGSLLTQNGKKIEVIDQQKVSEWTDENAWEDFTQIGKALEADMVVAIELEDFRLHQGQTLYQGRANVQIKVYDMKDGGKLVFEKAPRPSIYPPNTGIPTSEKQESQFRREYVGVLAEEIACHFYDHDSRANFAIDSTAL